MSSPHFSNGISSSASSVADDIFDPASPPDIYSPPTTPESSSTEENLPPYSRETHSSLSSEEQAIIDWMRAHPKQPFKVDAAWAIYPLEEDLDSTMTSLPQISGLNTEEYIDLTNEPLVKEHTPRARRYKGISQEHSLLRRRDGDRPAATYVRTAPNKVRQRNRGLQGARASSERPQTMTVSGASVLYGASNFVISGSSIAPGAFSAIAGDQEIWYFLAEINSFILRAD
ncbi:hypothetical protein BDP27DRAFT_1315070 [Rhodocollybia butyracea]|uniref:Uncharacterized protein n=1 Tax=Rhodocollybia butyracea TaxID=206335 RepID=A0A9P5UDS3_9AGAR|nr:hypothetical protein BDP27DRAFT_1315070 [Rhodocollybia butyracea]